MIYTVTLNPSIDYLVNVDSFLPGVTNRAKHETVMPGGKGINVSLMLRHLGVANTALGFLSGFSGDEIERLMREENVDTRFIKAKLGFSRINVKIKAEEESEINGCGPTISDREIDELLHQVASMQNTDTLVLSGSVPSSVPNSIYRDIARLAEKQGARFVADASGELLLSVLPHHPFLVKPNHHELGELFGVQIQTREQAVEYAKCLLADGAQHVLVSLAEKGAVLVCEKGVFAEDAPCGKIRNSVGAGDSMVAGFLFGLQKFQDLSLALKMGVAAGSASAFSDGIATCEQVYQIFKTISSDPSLVEKIAFSE